MATINVTIPIIATMSLKDTASGDPDLGTLRFNYSNIRLPIIATIATIRRSIVIISQ